MRIITMLLSFFLSNTGMSAESSGFRNITDLGCHNGDGTCYISLDGAPVTGASGCSSNSIRWDSRNDANGKATLALMMMAKSLNLKVLVYTSSCYPLQPAFPQIQYVNILYP